MFFFLLLVFCTNPQAAALGPVEAMVQVARENTEFWKISQSFKNSFWVNKPFIYEAIRPPGHNYLIRQKLRNIFNFSYYRYFDKNLEKQRLQSSQHAQCGHDIQKYKYTKFDGKNQHLSHFFEKHSNFTNIYYSQILSNISIKPNKIEFEKSRSIILLFYK